MRIIGISGSLRKRSFNTALLRAAASRMPSGSTLELARIDEFPVFNEDLEATAFPAAVTALKDEIAACDGVILSTPEYNGSIPGPLKNAVDWLTRPSKDIARVFGDRPFGLVGASPGRGATRLGQAAWLPVMLRLGVRPYFGGSLYVGEAGSVFAEDGSLTDARVERSLKEYVAGFVAFADAQKKR